MTSGQKEDEEGEDSEEVGKEEGQTLNREPATRSALKQAPDNFDFRVSLTRMILRGAGANCSLTSLGDNWDRLLTSPSGWTGLGFPACGEGGHHTRPSIDLSSHRNASASQLRLPERGSGGCVAPAAVRLSVCPSQAWWPQAAAAALDLVSVCQSREACARICYGHRAWNASTLKVVRSRWPPTCVGATEIEIASITK